MISEKENVTKIAPHLASIKAPSILASKPIWLLWRFEHHEGETKPRKVPYYVNGSKRYGVQGRLEDRQNLTTFEAARAAAVKRGFDGIGHACLDGDFTVVDFDRCAPGGKLDPIIEALASDTYAEYSPSGEGIHLYVKGNLHNANVKSTASNDQFGIELFATKGFVTFTGNTLEITDMLGVDDTVAEPSSELKTLVYQRFGHTVEEFSQPNQAPLGVSREVISEALEVLDADVGYQDWLRIGMAIHHETNGEGFDLWDQWSAKGAKYPGAGALEGHWQSFGKNPGKVLTIKTLVQMANANGARISLNAISMEEFENLDNQLVNLDSETGYKPRFSNHSAFDFAVAFDDAYLVKGVIPKAALGILYGESGSGKSFITLDLAMAIATGTPWRGCRTTQGRVVYVAAEGANGFRNRLIAYSKAKGLDLQGVPLTIFNDRPNLLIKEHVKFLVDDIKATGPLPEIIIIDTLAQTTPGSNENASEDMGKAFAHCEGLHRATGAMVLLIHHSGKDASKGARGWSGMRAAADVELEVTRLTRGRVLRTTKQKDGADFKEWGFDLDVVALREDQDGDVITSCVVVEAEVPVKEKKHGPNEQAILNVLTEIGLEQTAGIPRGDVLDLALSEFSEEESSRKARRNNLNRSLKKICGDPDSGYVLESDDTISIS